MLTLYISLYLSRALLPLRQRVLSAANEEPKEKKCRDDVFLGKIRHLKIASLSQDDERGRGASIASPFNDDDDDAFEKKSFQRGEFRSSLFEKEESFEWESRGGCFFVSRFDGENNNEHIEPRDDDVNDVYVYVHGYRVRTNEKRRRERNTFSTPTTPRRYSEYYH